MIQRHASLAPAPAPVETAVDDSLLSPWEDAALAAALFAIDPVGTGGVALRALAGPVRDRWLALARGLLPPHSPRLKIPLHVSDSRLLGGLDLAGTLRTGRPLAERGLLAQADGGVVELSMAERLGGSTIAHLTAVLDAGEVVLERDGITSRAESRLGVIALDEGVGEDEHLSEPLRDRLAFHLDLGRFGIHDSAAAIPWGPDEIQTARARLPTVGIGDGHLETLCGAALVLGIASLRGSLLAIRVARLAAALAGRDQVEEEDLATAARLVLAPRATRLPAGEPAPEESPPPEPPQDGEDQDEEERETPDRPLEDMVLEAAQAAISKDVLDQLRSGIAPRSRARSQGKAGAQQHASLRGRPIGARRGEPGPGVRMNVVETLRAAAPWQPMRRRDTLARGLTPKRVEVRKDDFRVTRFKQRAETTTIFTVDASGSSALHRLAEAKGAIELLLASCYVRRDRVALVAFRGQGAEILLPPTRSLVRAKRSLASLPGGGGTPLAAGIDLSLLLADAVQRRGGTPTLVLLTDGRANVARDGQGGRAKAGEEALSAARRVRSASVRALLVDTSPHPQPKAREVAEAMGATYLPLPYADAGLLSAAVQIVAGPAGAVRSQSPGQDAKVRSRHA
jgi:magnesium chelatase subunit D